VAATWVSVKVARSNCKRKRERWFGFLLENTSFKGFFTTVQRTGSCHIDETIIVAEVLRPTGNHSARAPFVIPQQKRSTTLQ
jgi:hypothetical protein